VLIGPLSLWSSDDSFERKNPKALLAYILIRTKSWCPMISSSRKNRMTLQYDAVSPSITKHYWINITFRAPHNLQELAAEPYRQTIKVLLEAMRFDILYLEQKVNLRADLHEKKSVYWEYKGNNVLKPFTLPW
jgi:hypothetical protein